MYTFRYTEVVAESNSKQDIKYTQKALLLQYRFGKKNIRIYI